MLVAVCLSASAQNEYKLTKASGKLILNNISNLSVVGYSGGEIVFTLLTEKGEDNLFANDAKTVNDPRAAGLSALNNNGFDNTGIGLAISEKGTDVFVSPVRTLAGTRLEIKLPGTVALSVRNNGWPFSTSKTNVIALTRITSEVDIESQFGNCKLTDITGPLSIKTMGGNIEVTMNKGFKGPVSLNSVSGFIDLTVAPGAKADLTMNTLQGTIYADKSMNLAAVSVAGRELTGESLNLSGAVELRADTIIVDGSSVALSPRKMTIERNLLDSARSMSLKRPGNGISVSLPYSGASPSFSGTLNGGGQKIKLQSMTGNIYLRK